MFCFIYWAFYSCFPVHVYHQISPVALTSSITIQYPYVKDMFICTYGKNIYPHRDLLFIMVLVAHKTVKLWMYNSCLITLRIEKNERCAICCSHLTSFPLPCLGGARLNRQSLLLPYVGDKYFRKAGSKKLIARFFTRMVFMTFPVERR